MDTLFSISKQNLKVRANDVYYQLSSLFSAFVNCTHTPGQDCQFSLASNSLQYPEKLSWLHIYFNFSFSQFDRILIYYWR